MDPAKPAAKRADALVAAMSTEQKLHMVTFGDPPWFLYYGVAGHVTGIPELCIPDLILSDAGSGVAGMQYGTTTFPSGVAQAATWDPSVQRLGRPDHRRGGARQGHQRDARPRHEHRPDALQRPQLRVLR